MVSRLLLGHESSKTPEFSAEWMVNQKTSCPEIKWGSTIELERMILKNEVNVVDVRVAEDYAEGHIPGAVNLPKDRWETLEGLRRDKLKVQ